MYVERRRCLHGHWRMTFNDHTTPPERILANLWVYFEAFYNNQVSLGLLELSDDQIDFDLGCHLGR